jgi:hypothetical protein
VAFACHALADAAVAADLLVGDPPALFAREEGDESRDITRLADAEGRALLKSRLQFFEQSAKQFCFHGGPSAPLRSRRR